MKRTFLALILLFGALPITVAQVRDSTFLGDREGQDLGEVTVTASAMTNRIDRKLVFPTERQRRISTNGVDLLQQLMLPKVQVNPLLHTVSLPGGGELQLRINGVKAEVQDIVALQPADIIRIEFHDNPGLRYNNAEVVLDYIVRRPETGGNVGVNLTDAVDAAWGSNAINGRINHKQSEFSVSYDISHRDFYRMWRDNEEVFHFANGDTRHRKEVGEPGHLELSWQNLKTAYSYQNDQQMFNATFRYHYEKTPHMDYHGLLYEVGDEKNAVNMIDNSSGKGYRPALDLYYQQKMENGQTLVFNLVGTYNSTDNARLYQERDLDGALLTDVKDAVAGKKYSVIGEGIYEKKMGANSINAGLKHTQSHTNNKYEQATSEMNQADTYLYGEFKGKVQKLDYTLGVGATRSYFGQQGTAGREDYTFNPRLVLRYALPGESSIRLKSEVRNVSPALSNLSNIEQEIDSWQIQRGNPNLKPYLRYMTELTYELKKGIFYGNLQGIHDYLPHAIMDEKRQEGNNKIIQTWDNQTDWQRLNSSIYMRVGPIKDILQVSGSVVVNHFISHGNTYSHTYTDWVYNLEMSASYKKFMAVAQLYNGRSWFYGETMTGGEKNMFMLMLGYKHKEMALNAGIMNPFTDNYKQDSENRSQYASYKKSNYINESSRMVMLQFSYNFTFGRTFNSRQKWLNNADDDAGVMKTGK
ncbi:MAG: outer membrane beta-barrel family protein [Candidatus Symbiothrix sp.]|jgi:hypothetical protein|nr:outer membrane beta-barrel family protein [Candidatus Symbiothrix sp.]